MVNVHTVHASLKIKIQKKKSPFALLLDKKKSFKECIPWPTPWLVCADDCFISRHLLQLHHVHGGEQCSDHYHDSQLPSQAGRHPWNARLGKICYKVVFCNVQGTSAKQNSGVCTAVTDTPCSYFPLQYITGNQSILTIFFTLST